MSWVLLAEAAKENGVNWNTLIVTVGTALTGLVTGFSAIGKWVVDRLNKAEEAAASRERECRDEQKKLKEDHEELNEKTIKVVVDAVNRNTKAFEESTLAQRKMMGILSELKKSSNKMKALEARKQHEDKK